VTRTTSDIDALIGMPKTLFGEPRWVEHGNKAELTSALMFSEGVLGGVSIRAWAHVHLVEPAGAIVLVVEQRAVQRALYRPDHPHVNGSTHPIPPELRRRLLPPDRSREYLWRDNRVFPPPLGFQLAGREIDPQPSTMEEMFVNFLNSCFIEGTLPRPPHRPALI
jgi:hypothetical protein